jgi:hypothetical protein
VQGEKPARGNHIIKTSLFFLGDAWAHPAENKMKKGIGKGEQNKLR